MVDRKDKWAATLERIASSASWSGGQRFAAEPEGRFRVSGEDRKKYKSSQRHSLLVMFIFACIGIFIGVIENEVQYQSRGMSRCARHAMPGSDMARRATNQVRYHALENLWDVDLYITIMKSGPRPPFPHALVMRCPFMAERMAGVGCAMRGLTSCRDTGELGDVWN